MMASAEVLSLDGKNILVKGGYNFIKQVIIDMVFSGDRQTCPYCGGEKKIWEWICTGCFSRAQKERKGKGYDIVESARQAFEENGGEIEQQSSQEKNSSDETSSWIPKEDYDQIVSAGITLLNDKGNSDLTEADVIEHLQFMFNEFSKDAVAAAGKKAFGLHGHHQELWQAVQGLVEKWFDQHLDDFRKPGDIARAIMDDQRPTIGPKMITAAVAEYQQGEDYQKSRKSWTFSQCEKVAQGIFSAKLDNRHPGAIAKDFLEDYKGDISLPLAMLTKAIANEQDNVRQKERQRLAGPYSGTRKRKVRGKKYHSKNPNPIKIGAKKRGAKCHH